MVVVLLQGSCVQSRQDTDPLQYPANQQTPSIYDYIHFVTKFILPTVTFLLPSPKVAKLQRVCCNGRGKERSGYGILMFIYDRMSIVMCFLDFIMELKLSFF